MKCTIALLAFGMLLLGGCTTTPAIPLPQTPQVRLFYSFGGLSLHRVLDCRRNKCEPVDYFSDLALLSDDGIFWIHTKDRLKDTSCTINLDSPTALRITAVWKRSAPLLNKVERAAEESLLSHPVFYTFGGYSREDLNLSMPPNDSFSTIEAMLDGVYEYCRRKSSAGRRSMERSLEALEASYAKQ